MKRQIASFAFMVCGIIALVSGFTMLPAPTSVVAQSLGPRPPLDTPTPNQARKPTEVIPGRLTGTVIDLRTNAPTAGIAVAIGKQTVYSDANGNYDSWVTSGYYEVELKPTSAQGESVQPLQRVAVGPGDTVVVHLFFKSPAPTIVAQAVTSVAPTLALVSPTVVPSRVPNTPVPHVSPVRPGDHVAAPQSLPDTAAPAGIGTPGTWLLFGTVMLGLGILITLTPRSCRRALSASERKAARNRDSSDESLLSELLDRDL